jgi:hypothetical protein
MHGYVHCVYVEFWLFLSFVLLLLLLYCVFHVCLLTQVYGVFKISN